MASSALPLIAAFLVAAALPSSAAAQSLRGRVLDGTTQQPVGGATVRLLDPDSQQVAATIADDGGLFTLPAPAAGEYRVEVDRFGYNVTVAGPVRLRANGFSNVTVTLMPRPVPVAPVDVEVEAEDDWLRSSGFYERRQEGMGKYLGLEEIQRRAPGGRMADVLGGISGVRVIADNGATDLQVRGSMTNVFRAGGPQLCLPLIFVDGLLMTDAKMPGPGRMNLEQIRPQDVAGIEIYGEAGVPLQYARGGGQCGAVLFWTRSGPGRR